MDLFLKTYLERHNIKYKIYKHPAVFTVAESDKIKTLIPGVRSKNLFLRDEKNKFYLYCLPGEKRADLKAIKKNLGVKELHFASSEELKKELNLTPGSVSLFGMIHAKNTRLLIDKEIWEAQEVGFHPNINTATLVINHKDLEKFCNNLSSWEVLSLA